MHILDNIKVSNFFPFKICNGMFQGFLNDFNVYSWILYHLLYFTGHYMTFYSNLPFIQQLISNYIKFNLNLELFKLFFHYTCTSYFLELQPMYTCFKMLIINQETHSFTKKPWGIGCWILNRSNIVMDNFWP